MPVPQDEIILQINASTAISTPVRLSLQQTGSIALSRVAVTDYTFESLDLEKRVLEPLGLEVVGAQCRTPTELVELLQDADFVITQFAPVDASVIDAMRKA